MTVEPLPTPIAIARLRVADRSVGTGVLARLLRTDAAVGPFVLRVVLGLVLLPHGAQKLFGWFGGHGFEGTMGFLTGAIGLPYLVALLVVAIESLGALALVVGFASRAAAAGVVAVMTGAVLSVHLPHGFFMNWSATQGGEGFEYHLLAIGMALAIAVAGGGALSLDRALARRLER
jgi:putative oxidoreductase